MLDGFDLGVGVLFPFAPDDHSRNLMMDSVRRSGWQRNLLVLGASPFAAFRWPSDHHSGELFSDPGDAAGPHFPRVAFEFRMKAHRIVSSGSRVFLVLCWPPTRKRPARQFRPGYEVHGRQFAGSYSTGCSLSIDLRLRPRVRLRVLGATWLVTKTEAGLQQCEKEGAACIVRRHHLHVIVSIWTPLLEPKIAHDGSPGPISHGCASACRDHVHRGLVVHSL